MKTKTIFHVFLLGLSISLLFFASLPNSANAAVITVDTIVDEHDNDCGDGTCSLRDAIAVAAPGDTVSFDAGLAGQTIVLSLGRLTIDKDLIIDGTSLAPHITISGNSATQVFYITSGVFVTLTQLDIIDGLTSGGSGGGLETYGDVTLNDCTLSNNSAVWGGGIFNAGALSLNRCTLSDNTAAGNGGGILNEFGGTLSATDSTFRHNVGTYGGGIRNQGILTVNGGVLEDNEAEWGGGMDHYYGEATVAGSTFRSNTALYGGGGITSGDTLNVSDSTFEMNEAGAGGGIECHNASVLTVETSTFTGNKATGAGGAIINVDGTVEVTGGSFNGNSSAAGGGISNDGTMEVADSVFDSNSSAEGGGISSVGVMTVTVSTLSNNAATSAGGAIINYDAGIMAITDSTLSDNWASNAPSTPPSGFGGGIENLGALTLNGGSLSGNTALLHGGGIENWGGSLTVNGASFVSNGADGSGGAVVNNDAGWLGVTGSLFQDNSADTGGAIYNDNASDGEITSGTFASNHAVSSGGGIYNASGKMRVMASTLDGNSAGYGGGIRNDATMTVTLSTLQTNTADFGGAIHNVIAGAGKLWVDSCSFESNTTVHYGAGIYNGATLNVKQSTFHGNEADAGGGIYNDSVASVGNSTFCDNTAISVGGGIINNSDLLTLNNCTFDGNSAGGGGGGIGNGAMLNYRNTLVANSTSGGDCFNTGTIGYNVNNLVEDASCSSLYSGDPLLDLLGNNGGPTRTCALQLGSQAIDAGDNTTCLATDQRNYVRPADGGSGTATCDIGAFEYNSMPLLVVLAHFDAQPEDDHVVVTWETTSELDNAGFNLLRATTSDGKDRALLIFVPAQFPGSAQGAAYSYVDATAQAGRTHWYWLEDVALSGVTSLHGPVSATVQAPTSVVLADGGVNASTATWPGSGSAIVVALSMLALAVGRWRQRQR